MFEIDKEQFGLFLQELRKSKGYTQKELAAKLFISDKAVSKWERGINLPDTALLLPLSEVFGVTVTELLKGQRLEKTAQFTIDEVEKLVTDTLETAPAKSKKWRYIFYCSAGLTLLELIFLYLSQKTILFQEGLFASLGLSLTFGAWFCLFARERLPRYYDENKIFHYGDGFVHLSLGGIPISNSNWPYIIKTGRIWNVIVSPLIPFLFFLIDIFLPDESLFVYIQFVALPSALGMFIPMIIAAKKHAAL